MGFTDWLSGLFKPKEIKQALREGQDEIRKAEEEARKNILPKTELKQMARESDKAAKEAAKEMKKLEIEGKKERDMLKKLPSKVTPEDLEGYFFAKGHKMESEQLALVEGNFKKMHFDYFEKVGKNLSQVFGEMKSLSQQAEKLAVTVGQQFAEQENELENLIKINTEREKVIARLKEIAHGKTMIVPDRKTIKLEEDLFTMRANLDKRMVESFKKVLDRAREGSYFRQNMKEHLRVLALLSSYSNEASGRIRYEMFETEKMLALQKSTMPVIELALGNADIEANSIAVAVNILKYRKAS
ncbi:hypothetical protein HZB90_02000 [archaeon]|nr:hypothetical protein [archaeon]